jgi:hypothetical protein
MIARLIAAIIEGILNFIWGNRDADNEAVEITDCGGPDIDEFERL